MPTHRSAAPKASAGLLSRARDGDREALGLLLEEYRNYLALLARLHIGRRLNGKVGASDVVQETFLQAHRAFERFEGRTEAELIQWLRRILSSRIGKQVRLYCGTDRRDLQRERALDEALDSSSRLIDRSLADSGTSPSGRAAGHEQAIRLADVLARLPEDYRDVIELRHLQGLTFPEVALRMERSQGSVEKLWMRALARLRAALEGP